jgi:opacity protein-like surface antigen
MYMKKILLALILAAVSCLSVFAADYVATVRNDRVWEYESFGGKGTGGAGDYRNYHFVRFGGEVTVNGNIYNRNVLFLKKRYFVDYETGITSLVEESDQNITLCFMREEDGKVYTLASAKDSSAVTAIGDDTSDYYDALLYDWSKQDGEAWDYTGFDVDSPFQVTVQTKAPLTVDGEECRVMTFDIVSHKIDFIEGLGVTWNGSIGKFTIAMVTAINWINDYEPGFQSSLVRVYNSDGTVIYGDDSPVGIELTKAEYANNESGAIYDLMGRRVERVLPGSVYVRDGKKFVGK